MNFVEEDFNNISDLQDNVVNCVVEFVCNNPKFENCSFGFKVIIENGWVSHLETNFLDHEI